jgi:hypothetical protein
MSNTHACYKEADSCLDRFAPGVCALSPCHSTPSPFDLDLVARTCTLAAQTVADRGPLIRLVESGLAAGPQPRSGRLLTTLGGLLDRQGQSEQATRVLEESLARNKGSSALRDHALLALAHAHAGRHADARRYLDQGKAGAAAPAADTFWDVEEVRLLRAEAQAILDGARQ